MFGSAVLEVLIGLVVVFFVLSVVCSALNEAWASLSGARGRILELGVQQLLGKALTAEFFASPRIQPLCPPDRWIVFQSKLDKLMPRRPSYVPNATFAEVVLDRLVPRQVGAGAESRLRSEDERLLLLGKLAAGKRAVGAAPARSPLLDDLPSILARAHAAVPDGAEARSSRVLAMIEKEFSDLFQQTMDRATGWYRRRAQASSLLFAVPVVLLTNADAIQLTKALYRDPALRAEMTAMGESLAKSETATESSIQRARQHLASLADKAELPLGWPDRRLREVDERDPPARIATPVERRSFGAVLGEPMKWLGWLISIVAASLGAPFWFQMLNKLVSLRGSGKATAVASTGEPVAGGQEPAGTAADSSTAAALLAVAASPAPPMPAKMPELDAAYWERLGRLPVKSAVAAAGDGAGKDLGLALDCARLSAAVYRDLGVAAKFAACAGYDVDGNGTFDRNGTQVLVAARGDDVIVCYRGTEPDRLEDWLADAKFKLVPATAHGLGKGRVHSGFAAALAHVATEVDELLQAKVGAKTRLVFTGHSLGAALATLHAYRWRQQREVALLTFGSPRVGDGEFVGAADALLGTGLSLRFVNGRDLVTRVPPRSLGYDHLGSVRYFDDRGRMQDDGAEWFRWLADVLDAADDFKAAAGRTIQDHAMERYVARLEAAFAVATA